MSSSEVSLGSICTVVQPNTDTHELTTFVSVEEAFEAMCILLTFHGTIVTRAQEPSEQEAVVFLPLF